MDPNANIQNQLQLAKEINALYEGDGEPGTIASKGYALADLVEDLDEWRKKGGFDPYAKARIVLVVFLDDDDHLLIFEPPIENSGLSGKVTVIGSNLAHEDYVSDHLNVGDAANNLGEALGLPVRQLDMRDLRCNSVSLLYEQRGVTPEGGLEDVIHLLESGKYLEDPELFILEDFDEDLTVFSTRLREQRQESEA